MNIRLSDSSTSIRYTSLLVLTHLLLNDMVKVKGHVSQVALCLSDDDDHIRALAALLFRKLAERSNNPVYNLLGDIIGTLSSHAAAIEDTTDTPLTVNDEKSSTEVVAEVKSVKLTPAQFKTTMIFLLSFVKKDKQADGLMERLMVL